jgi:hypothetical protein
MAVYTYITWGLKQTMGQIPSDAKAIMKCIRRRLLPFPEREPDGAVTPTSASEYALVQQ